MNYRGFGETPEKACADLERQLQLDANSGAFVTLEEEKSFSPRRRIALANIRDGTPYRVKLSRTGGKEKNVCASVKFNKTSPIVSPRGNAEELIMYK